LNVFVAPTASDPVAHVKTQWFDLVAADVPLPLRGLSVAPLGTVSFVQWTPLGTSKATVRPTADEGPSFFTERVPQ
jgi:hypothetical protein